jgi:hypothetical protein
VALVSSSLIACASETTPTAEPASNPCAPATAPAAHVSYEAVTADGHYVVLIDGPGAESRVFYGTADHMTEGRVTGTSDSCAHAVDFSVASTSYSAVFAPATCNNNIQSRLFIGNPAPGQAPVPTALTVLIGVGPQAHAGAALSPTDLTYLCF